MCDRILPATVDACLAALHAAGWSVGDTAYDRHGRRMWIVFGRSGEHVIVGRGPSELEAWQAAVMAAESVE